MKWFRLLLIISLLAGMLLCPGVIYADGGDDDSGSSEDSTVEGSGLVVGIGIVGDNPEVNIGVDGDDAEINVGVGSKDTKVNLLTGEGSEINMGVGQESIVYVNGQDVNQPTVIHNHSGESGASIYQVYRAIQKRLEPLYFWMEDRDEAIGLTMDGLAKVILTINGQDSVLNEQSSRLDVQEEEIAALQNSIDSKMLSLENQLAVSRQHTEDMRIVYNRNIVILFSLVGALVIMNVLAFVKLYKAKETSINGKVSTRQHRTVFAPRDYQPE